MPIAAGPRPTGLALRSALALVFALGQLAAPRPVLAQQQSGDVGLKSPHAILMDADSGAVLFQRAADAPVPPANLSTLMLLAMVFAALKSGDLKLDADFLMSEYAWRTGGAPSRTQSMFVPLGKTAKVEELVKGAIVQYGNDAAISLAENLLGNEGLAAEAMTHEALRLGLKKAMFKNASGLYHPQHLMTVREIAQIVRHIIKEYPEYYPLFAQREFHYRHHKFYNRDPLLALVPGVELIRSGSVKGSGFSIAASAKQDNRRLILAIAGAASPEERRDDARRLLEWGFKNFSEVKIFEAGETVGHARVWGGERMYLPLVGNGGVSVVLPRHPANPKVTARIYYMGPLKPPLKKGEQVATLRVTTSADATSEVPLYAAEDVGPAGFVRRGLDSLLYLATRWIP